jgi:hypothetical protein
MFHIEGRVAKADVREQQELEGIIRGLEADGFVPLLRSLTKAASETAGLAARALPVSTLISASRRYVPGSAGPTGDVFFRNARAYALHPLDQQLYAWEIRHSGDDPDLQAFCDSAEESARGCLDGRRLRGMQFTWEDVEIDTPTRGALRPYPVAAGPSLAVEPAQYEDSEASAARLLVARERRESLISLAQMRGRVRAVDAEDESKAEGMGALFEAGLVRDEYLVLCRGDSRTILTAPSKEALTTSEFRCPVCSRKMCDELVQKVYAVTEKGQELLAGNHWMTVWVTERLEEAGVPRDWISWHGAAGDDEVDVIVTMNGLQYFLELKDRQFGLGDAYPFASRASRYGADAGAVLCTDTIAVEAKSYFEDRSGVESVPIDVVEGEKAIPTRLRGLVGMWSAWGISRVLNEMLGPVAPMAVPVLTKWMQERDRRPVRQKRKSTKSADATVAVTAGSGNGSAGPVSASP